MAFIGWRDRFGRYRPLASSHRTTPYCQPIGLRARQLESVNAHQARSSGVSAVEGPHSRHALLETVLRSHRCPSHSYTAYTGQINFLRACSVPEGSLAAPVGWGQGSHRPALTVALTRLEVSRVRSHRSRAGRATRLVECEFDGVHFFSAADARLKFLWSPAAAMASQAREQPCGLTCIHAHGYLYPLPAALLVRRRLCSSSRP